MTRYSPIIGCLLAWQLLLPVLCFFACPEWCVALPTAAVFVALLASKAWERNTYSFYSAVCVVALSLALAAFGGRLLFVAWIYALVAFTATSPYPLSIRMPLIIYTLVYVFMIPADAPIAVATGASAVFSAAMCLLALKWKSKTQALSIACGPPEPPYSFSLATAIVAAVAINLGLSIAEHATPSKAPACISLILLTAICAWLLCSKDWTKNPLAVTALALMITLHAAKILEIWTSLKGLAVLASILAVAPVMFHTTAPVFRGMRIVITLFAVYTALNRQQLVAALSQSHLPVGQQHGIIIAIDAVLFLTLLAMALHWRAARKRIAQ